MKTEEVESRQLKIYVCISNINYDDDISQIDEAIDLQTKEHEPCKFGVNIFGKTDQHYNCTTCDDLGRSYCRVERTRELRRQRSDYRWLPEMLKYYWQNGVDIKSVAFLSGVRFVHSYEYGAS